MTLRAPVAGRPVTGAAFTRGGFGDDVRIVGAHSLQVIPRVIGLAPADAARVLRQQGFAAQAPRPAGDARPAITEQLPSAGIAVGGPGGPVRVRLSTTPRPRAEPRAGRAPCTAATCVAAPRFDSAVGRGISAAGVTFDVIGFGGPDGEDPQGRVFLGGSLHRNSGGPLTCAKVRGRVAVGGFRIETSDDPAYIGKGLIIHGQDNGRAPADRAVDRGNAYVVDQPPTTCPEPDASQANIDLCGDLTIRDAKAGSPAFVRRLKVKPPESRPCTFAPVSAPPVLATPPGPGPAPVPNR